MVYITKAIEFSATHRLYNPTFSEQRNQEVFGKCNNPNGHGHNYRLEVTLQGEPNPETGMLIDLAKLKEILQEEVMSRLDHKHLNLDVAEMNGVIPTAENIARVIWELLIPRFPNGELRRVRLIETRDNIIEYDGQ